MFFFELNYFTITLFLGGIIAIFSSTIVYLSDFRSKVNENWFLSNFFAAIWSFGYLTMIATKSPEIAKIANLVLHGAAIYIPLFYLAFVLHLTKFWDKWKNVVYGLYVLSIGFIWLNFDTSFVAKVIPKYVFNFAPDAGPAYIYFTLYFFAIVIFSLILISIKIKETPDENLRKKLIYTLVASSFGFAGGGSVFFLTFNILLPPYPLLLFAVYPMVISYAVIRHQLFEVKVIATELFVLMLWVFLLVRFIISNNVQDRVINGFIFLGTMLIGTLVIKSVLKEVHTREEMEKLAEQLAEANGQLRELDRQKSEFVSIASHQLRSPLTAMKGYSSMLLEGSFGKIEDKARMAVDRIFQSSQRLVIIIEDFLNLSRIEQGRMQYTIEEIDLEPLVQGVVQDLQAEISHTPLKLDYESDGNRPYKVKADSGKINQVVTNLIDNSIKYTNEGGVTARLEKAKDGTITVKIIDTGIGIPDSVMSKLFKKFSRAEQAGKENIKGTGLGLFVAGEIIKAHGGKIWAESKGKNKGSTFFIEFPVKNKVE